MKATVAVNALFVLECQYNNRLSVMRSKLKHKRDANQACYRKRNEKKRNHMEQVSFAGICFSSV